MEFTGEEISTPPVEEEVVESIEEEEGQVEEAAPAEPEISEKVKGLEAAISREREERRILQAKAEYLEQLAFQRENSKNQQEPEFDPDDYPTNMTVEQMVEKKLGTVKQAMREQQIIQMEEAAKTKYNDFEDVVKTFTDELVKQNPDMYNVIMNSKNPAETAYAYGKTHPKYLEKIQKNTAQTIAKKIDKASNSTSTLSSIGGVSNDKMQSGYFNRLPKAEFEKMVAEVMSKP